ncbi:hypothetical protein CASFOL_012056 [Castilleja foliolosa]|uniref:RRM domain-containing protein n=1 Tax=Castilleja foliolosa TaxID=1961234 RepID=A0ABD3DTC9_9LAMI
MHPQMSTKPPSTAPPPRRNYTNPAGKLTPSSSHPTPITPTSSGSAAAVIPTPTTVIPSNLETSQNTVPPNHAVTGKPPETPSHAATFLPQSSEKARVTSPGLLKPDVGKINVHNKSVEPEEKVLVNFGPGNFIHEGGEGVVMSGNGKGKKKIVKKIVKVVRKVIVKKRVPKRVLMSGSENQGVMEINKSSNLDNDVIEKSSFLNEVNVGSQIVDEVMEKSDLVNDGFFEKSNLVDGVSEKKGLVDEVAEKSDLVNDGFVEKLNLVDGMSEKNSLVCEVMEKSDLVNDVFFEKTNLVDGVSEKSSLVDEVIEKSDLVNDGFVEKTNLADGVSEKDSLVDDKVACEKSNDISGFEFMEAKVLKLDSCARGSELVESKSNVADQSNKAREKKGKYTAENCKTGYGGILENDRVESRQQNEIFIGGLDKGTNEYDVRKVFEEAGKIVEVRLAQSNNTGIDKCFAFVSFATAADANNALQKYSQVVICGKLCNASIAKTCKRRNKQVNRLPNRASKQMKKDYSQPSQGSIKLNEPRNIDTSSFTNNRFVDSFRQQAPANYIPPPNNIGPAIPDHRYPLLGTKRPFSHLGHDPFYAEPNMLPPWHFGNSHPRPGPSVSSNGFNMAPFPYYHQQRPSFTPGPPVDGWNMHTGRFQRNEQAPHYGNYPSYPRN